MKMRPLKFIIPLIIVPYLLYPAQPIIKLITPAKRYILIEDGKETSYYEITPERPLKVNIEGPITIYIEMRLNLDALSPVIPSLVDLVIERDEETYDVYRVSPSGVAEEKYMGITDLIPSTKTKFRIDVPPGVHSYVISISSGATLGAVLKFTVPGKYLTPSRPEKVEEKPPQVPEKKEVKPKITPAEKFRKRFTVSPFITAGVTSETYSNVAFFLKGGVTLDLIIKGRTGLAFKTAGTYYPSEYYRYDEVTYNLTQPSVSEIRVDLIPLFTFTAYGEKFNSHLVEPAIGINFSQFIAGDFTRTFLGPAGGLRFGVRISKRLSISGDGLISYNIIDSKGNKAITGNPKVDGSVNLLLNIFLKRRVIMAGGAFEIMGYPDTNVTYGNISQSLDKNIRIYGGLFLGFGF